MFKCTNESCSCIHRYLDIGMFPISQLWGKCDPSSGLGKFFNISPKPWGIPQNFSKFRGGPFDFGDFHKIGELGTTAGKVPIVYIMDCVSRRENQSAKLSTFRFSCNSEEKFGELCRHINILFWRLVNSN